MRRRLRLLTGLALVAAALSSGRAQQTDPYDLVIANGRVIDPESGLDDVRHVGVSTGTIRERVRGSALSSRTVASV